MALLLLSLASGQPFEVEVSVLGEELRRLALLRPKSGLSLEVGQLGLGGRHPVMGKSPYANLQKTWTGGSLVDWRVSAQAAYIALKGRYFGEEAQPLPERPFELAGELGVSPELVARMKERTTYQDPWQTAGIATSSLLVQAGRAHTLFGPVDVSWAATTLAKSAYVGGRAAFDETAGLRLRLKGGGALGADYGRGQDLSPMVTNVTLPELDADLALETQRSSHAGGWASLPLGSGGLHASRTRQWGPGVRTDATELSLKSGKLSLAGRVLSEDGPSLEFKRLRARAAVSWQLSPSAVVSAGRQRHALHYGGVDLSNDASFVGMSIKPGNLKLGLDRMFDGKDKEKAPDNGYSGAVGRHVAAIGGSAVQLGDELRDRYRENKARWEADADALSRAVRLVSRTLTDLPADLVGELLEQLGRLPLSDDEKAFLRGLIMANLDPNSERGRAMDELIRRVLGVGAPASADALDAILARARAALQPADGAAAKWDASRPRVVELLTFLGSGALWETAGKNAFRHTVLEQAKGVEFDVAGGVKFRLSPAAGLAMVYLLQNRSVPLKPVTAADAQAIKGWLLRDGAAMLGAEASADWLLGLAESEIQRQLDENLLPQLERLLADPGYQSSQALLQALSQSLPPVLAQELRTRYGVDLQGLLAKYPEPEALRAWARGLPGQASAILRDRFKNDVDALIAELGTWGVELLRRESNLLIARAMMASEELDELSADGGLKPFELGGRMQQTSYTRLDGRKKKPQAAPR